MELQWLGVDTTNGPAAMFRELAERGESIVLNNAQLAIFAAYLQNWEDTMLDKLLYELELPPIDFMNGEQFSDWLDRYFVRKLELPQEKTIYFSTVMADMANMVENGECQLIRDDILGFVRKGVSYGG